ncbi:MAG TPA: NUDIX domain-containing protein [Polyangia bacterium]|jgi:ADP-ribose pyrophosphatase YjhB (NUDIX family)|nr:NUDIX domain-containing protein [Polyangia bacterium]
MALLLVAVAAALIGAAVAAVVMLAGFGAPGRRRRLPRKWTSAGGLVIDGRGRIALVRQRNRRGRWRWTLPKGRIDRGETAEAAALREVHEESGLRARILRPIVLHEGRFHFTYFFEMALEGDDGAHDGETKEVRLCSFAEAATMLRSRRDLRVLRRLVEMRTRVVSVADRSSR